MNYERHKVAWFWSKLAPNFPCLIKAFLVNWLMLVWSNYCVPSYYVSKFLETELLDIISRDIRLFSSGLICARIAQTCFSTVSRLQSRFEETVSFSPLISGESQLMLPLSIYWVPSCSNVNVNVKEILVTNHEIRGWSILNQTGPKFSFCFKMDFLYKLTNTTIAYLLCPLC